MTTLSGWQASLRDRLDAAQRSGRLRAAYVEAPRRSLVRLDTNDYLQLRSHPALAQAMCDAARAEGAGAGASRLAGGTHPLHALAEQRLAALVGAESATLFPAGYMANLAALTALTQPGDLLLLDRLSHASLIDAAALATSRLFGAGRAVRFFRHNDVENAAQQARRHLQRSKEGGVWIVVESAHSMDGDTAPLSAFAQLRDELAGSGRPAALLVDEAHALGVFGPGGAGLCAEVGCEADVVVFTASKALGAQGGVVAGPALVKRALENFARPLLYTTAVALPLAAAVARAAELVVEVEDRRDALRAAARTLRAALLERGWRLPGGETLETPILPLIVGEEEQALALAARLAEAGFAAPAIRPPTVAPGAARVRLSLHSGVLEQDVQRLVETVGEASSWRSSSRA